MSFPLSSIFHIYIIIGANGAGKTTTFRMLINDLRPTSGEIIINGININKTVSIYD
jgi:ABC-2 type transport system ATP-binding protein